ncbi:hemerythrin [Clostridium amylolyticum]|uniref:Hemerythrin n=1 Tax=Clostridium amylolyticum TaxID=1121298 RepID=A0A1M6ILH2_9CLOT|nr:bacteriohemerythrin [Clostridium amylolyticum]SHJ35336.1 hemerythrin [Clostridium amylolyticum]
MFIWKDDYKVGVPLIDDQHKELFRIGDKAFKLLKDKMRLDKYDDIVSILTELKDYTMYHFECEEKYMMESGYKGFFSHKVEHINFINKINEVDIDKIDLHQNSSILEILDFVYKWIDEHILVRDKVINEGSIT